MAAAPHVVIVGGGFGGVEAAKGLANVDVRVTLIDRRNHFLFQPLLYQVATAGLSPGDIAAPIRSILRRNYPPLDNWLRTHRDRFTWQPPAAGAITYVEYDLPIGSTELVERIRREKSVLLVPGDMLGLDRGLRFGFGYDIDRTLKALTLVDEVLAEVAA